MPIETKEIAAELFKKMKRLTNKKTVAFTTISSPQLPSSHSRRRRRAILRQPPPLLTDEMPYSGIWRRILQRLFPQQHNKAVTELSPLPNRQMPSSAYIQCSGCKGVFFIRSNRSIFRCPHCHRVHFDREGVEEESE
ncbi:hypothetical protein A2U01_0024315, partial [Trifolium medium]|nr:hypothetical protein [Trifolium medium]